MRRPTSTPGPRPRPYLPTGLCPSSRYATPSLLRGHLQLQDQFVSARNDAAAVRLRLLEHQLAVEEILDADVGDVLDPVMWYPAVRSEPVT